MWNSLDPIRRVANLGAIDSKTSGYSSMNCYLFSRSKLGILRAPRFIARGSVCRVYFSKPLQKVLLISLVCKDHLAVNSSADNMLKSPWGIYA